MARGTLLYFDVRIWRAPSLRLILLYEIAKEALDHQIQNHEATVDVLLDVAIETQKQFKRIIQVANEGEPNLKKIRSLASGGVLYTETCLHKYQWQSYDDSNVMPTPLNLPPNVQSQKRRGTNGNILPSSMTTIAPQKDA